MNKQTKVITSKNVRFSYANLLTPKSPVEGAEPVYSVSLIISKDDKFTIDKINNAIKAAYEEGANKLKGNSKVVPPLASLRSVLRDGDIDKAGDDCFCGYRAVQEQDGKRAFITANRRGERLYPD